MIRCEAGINNMTANKPGAASNNDFHDELEIVILTFTTVFNYF